MKQLLEVFRFDIIRNMKNFISIYMLIVPVVILIVLRLFLPSVENTEQTIAIVTEGPNAVTTEIVQYFDDLVGVKTYASIEDMEQKLRGIGYAEGLYWDAEKKQYVSMLELNRADNKTFSVSARMIRQYYYHQNYPDASRITVFTSEVPGELSNRTKISPVATMGGSIFMVYMIVLMGFILGLGVVNDKEEGADRAIRVSPVSRADYFIGKSIQPLLIILLYTIIALSMLGLMQVNIAQAYFVVLAAFPIVLLFGLILGALGKNETEAIGYGKSLAMIMMLGILGATLLPDSWHWVVWWSPFYWIYDIFEEIFIQIASWSGVVWKSVLMLGLTGFYFMLLKKKIIKGLS